MRVHRERLQALDLQIPFSLGARRACQRLVETCRLQLAPCVVGQPLGLLALPEGCYAVLGPYLLFPISTVTVRVRSCPLCNVVVVTYVRGVCPVTWGDIDGASSVFASKLVFARI